MHDPLQLFDKEWHVGKVLAVLIEWVLSENQERLALLQQRVEATQLGRVTVAHGSFPGGPSDVAIRRIQEARADDERRRRDAE